MINIRHTGIYVLEIEKMEQFYTQVFHMRAVCSNNVEENPMLNDLLRHQDSRILTTKLITPYGQEQHTGDMIELIQVQSFKCEALPKNRPIFITGVSHIAIGVDNMEETVAAIVQQGGSLETGIYTMENGNKVAFCRDPEGNWLELISRN